MREKIDGKYKVRVRRKTSKSHQFLMIPKDELELIHCPTGWMSPEGYNRYLRETLAKMREREAAKRKAKEEKAA